MAAPAAHPRGKRIVCVLPKGRALDVVRRLHAEKGVDVANVTSGRGQGMVKSIGYGTWVEVDMLSMSVPDDKADEVFWFVHEAGNLDSPGGGIIFQADLDRVTPFELPDMAEEA